MSFDGQDGDDFGLSGPAGRPTTGESVFKLIFCHNCGKELGEGTDFQYCPYCAVEMIKVNSNQPK